MKRILSKLGWAQYCFITHLSFQDRNAELRYCIQKFHVLALGRIDEESDRCQVHSAPQVPLKPPRLVAPQCHVHGVAAQPPVECSRQCVLNDVTLDARKAATLYRHYYPEGGWGWVVLVCSVLVHVLTLGLQLSCSQLVVPANRKFQQTPVNTAGESFDYCLKYIMYVCTVLFVD